MYLKIECLMLYKVKYYSISLSELTGKLKNNVDYLFIYNFNIKIFNYNFNYNISNTTNHLFISNVV